MPLFHQSKGAYKQRAKRARNHRFVFHTASKALIKLARIVFISLDKTKIDEVTHEILI